VEEDVSGLFPVIRRKTMKTRFMVSKCLLSKNIELTIYEGVSKSFRTESITKYTRNNNKHSLRSNTKGNGDKTH